MKKRNCPISAQLVIPASFAECITYEKQILWLKKEIDSLSGGGDPEAISELQRRVTALESKYTELQKQISDLSIDVIENELAVISADIQLIKNSLDTKQDVLTFDDTPTAGSSNPVRSEGILEAIHNEGMRVEQLINGKVDAETFNEAMRNIINNYVTTGNLTEALTAYAKLTDIADMATKTELSGYATKSEIEGLVTNEELTSAIADLATKTELGQKQDKLTFDNTPTAGSNNPVTSGGVYEALQNLTPTGTVDDTVTAESSNPVKSSGIYSFVKAEEENLATKEEIAGFITEDALTDYAKKTELEGLATKSELADYATKTELSGYATKSELSDYATKTELTDYAKTTDIADMATKTELADYAKTEDLGIYATKAELGEYVKDSELATELTNYATKAELSQKQDALIFDNTPTADSMNPVTSDGIKKAIDAIPAVTVDASVSQSSQNPVSSNGIYNFVLDQMGDLVTTDQLATKQDILTFDDMPTAGSSNVVKSSGIKTAIDNATTGLVNQEQLSNYATNDSVDGKLALYATKSEISDMETKTNAAATYATKSEILDMETKTNAAATYATKVELSEKQNVLTFDNVPTENSSNMLTSGSIYTALQSVGGGKKVIDITDKISQFPSRFAIYAYDESGSSTREGVDLKVLCTKNNVITYEFTPHIYLIVDDERPVEFNGTYFITDCKIAFSYHATGTITNTGSNYYKLGQLMYPGDLTVNFNDLSMVFMSDNSNNLNDTQAVCKYNVNGSNGSVITCVPYASYSSSGSYWTMLILNSDAKIRDGYDFDITATVVRDVKIQSANDFILTNFS